MEAKIQKGVAHAEEGPVQRQVKALDPERDAFEVWASGQGLDLSRLRQTYATTITAWCWGSWQAARPKRAAVGRLVNVAAVLTSPTPMRKLWQLEEEAGRTLGRRALSDALADSDERLKTLAIELAALARAL